MRVEYRPWPPDCRLQRSLSEQGERLADSEERAGRALADLRDTRRRLAESQDAWKESLGQIQALELQLEELGGRAGGIQDLEARLAAERAAQVGARLERAMLSLHGPGLIPSCALVLSSGVRVGPCRAAGGAAAGAGAAVPGAERSRGRDAGPGEPMCYSTPFK